MTPTALPTRPNYKPGELVDYVAQTGDTIPAVAAHFNTTADQIMAANPIIPAGATTMPPGLPMKVPIYFRSLWGTPFHILPDSAYVDGPAQIGFSPVAYVATQPGWLNTDSEYVPAASHNLTGAEIVNYVATNWSISPRLLLAILEYKAGALSQANIPSKTYILDFEQRIYARASNLNYLQLIWAANTLNNGYYGWRTGTLTEFTEPDGTIIRPDPWQNAATVALEYFFSRTSSGSDYDAAVGPAGFARTYEGLFGKPAEDGDMLIPGSLQQPSFMLPFQRVQVWTFTGGPHTGWGTGQPYAAVDFAPPCDHPGCGALDPRDYVVAMASGLVARSGSDGVMLDLDADGDERTGWNIFYLHLASEGRVALGEELKAGDYMGYPSSEGGEATGTHIHIARKYNGEWIPASGPSGFNLDGWVVHAGSEPYLGTLTRNGVVVVACLCSDLYSEVRPQSP
jgi:murein DD-endopeptidase MepM/ murein hydrolase activator NlpD